MYSDRDVFVLEHAYILPGLIDLSVRSNGQWQGSSAASRLAISGGVTFFLDEPNCLDLDSPCDQPLYCDVGGVALVTSLPIKLDSAEGAFALKGYLSPPGKGCAGLEGALREAVFGLTGEKLLILDLFCPSFMLRTTNTPFRTCGPKERLSAPFPTISDPAAFPGSQDDEGFQTATTQSTLDSSLLSESSPPGQKRSSFAVAQLQVEVESRKRRKLCEDTEMRLLSEMELARYTSCGKTIYAKSRMSEGFVQPKSEGRSGLLGRRRMQGSLVPLVTKRDWEESEESGSGINRLYVSYLANYPDFTELVGVRELTKALEANPCVHVHITNISSVSALNSLIQLKEKCKGRLSLETAPHFLYFSAERIQDGNTLLKSAPPIRQEDNRKLLVEFVRVAGIDAIGSSHSGLSAEHKRLHSGDFKRAVSGVSGLGSSLQVAWTACKPSENPDHCLVRLVHAMSAAPASILGILNQRGQIAPGRLADLVVFHPFERSQPLKDELSPYREEPLLGRIESVFLRGRRAFHLGEVRPVGRREKSQ